jgi:ferredoxin
MYNIGGRNLCHSCAVKILRIENLSPVEQMKRLQEHLK